jgi:hypothetical protein
MGLGNATEVIDSSQNDLAFGCSGNQDQIDIMTRMQANDWAAIA